MKSDVEQAYKKNSTEARWVVARYTGDRAKLVMAHAAAGLGYYTLETGRAAGQQFCVVAFVQAVQGPLEPHLTEITDPVRIARLEARRARRT